MKRVYASRVALCVLRFTPVLALLGSVLSLPAAAHERSISYSTWDIEGRNARVVVRLSELDASRLPLSNSGEDRDHALPRYLTDHLQLVAGESVCPLAGGPRRLNAAAGRVAFEWQVVCPDSGSLRIRSELLLDVAPSHLHFARVGRGAGEARERVLSDGERTWTIAAEPHGAQAQGTSFLGYLILGTEHILTGYDHLAFLLALLLIQSSVREVAKVVTGFTVAHSVTLGLATVGYVRPEPAAIEALIGLSIAMVAAENVWLVSGRGRLLPMLIGAALVCLALFAERGHGRVPAVTLAGLAVFSLCYFRLLARAARPAPLRWAIAFVFGLVHGFGFAAVLLEADLSSARLAQALLGFNLGVEAGQLAAVAMVWPLLRLAARHREDRLRVAILELGSAAVCGLGVFWFVARAYG